MLRLAAFVGSCSSTGGLVRSAGTAKSQLLLRESHRAAEKDESALGVGASMHGRSVTSGL